MRFNYFACVECGGFSFWFGLVCFLWKLSCTSQVLYKEGLGTGIPTPVTPEMERVKRNQEQISSVLKTDNCLVLRITILKKNPLLICPSSLNFPYFCLFFPLVLPSALANNFLDALLPQIFSTPAVMSMLKQ